MKPIEEMTLEELKALEAAIAAKIDEMAGTVTEEPTEEARSLAATLPTNAEELNSMIDKVNARKDAITSLMQKRSAVASGAVGTPVTALGAKKPDEREARAKKFAETNRDRIEGEQVRSVLVSGGTLATPTQVSGINDIPGVKFASLLDYVTVENCVGMGSDKVAYIAADAGEAAAQTEGQEATTKEPTFGYKTITPTSVAVKAQISKQAKKQSPLRYQQKVHEQALISLKKKAVSIIVTAMKASTLNTELTAKVNGTTHKGVIDQHTLRNIVFAYGGDESVLGEAVLLLKKTDLIAFGDVRGDNEKKGVYEIIPDGSNPNMGVIKDGGLSVKYMLCNGLTACAGTSQTAAKQVTMLYGDLRAAVKLDLFSDYEIRVSEDYAITSLMDTIVGDVELGADVVAKDALVAYTIPATA